MDLASRSPRGLIESALAAKVVAMRSGLGGGLASAVGPSASLPQLGSAASPSKKAG